MIDDSDLKQQMNIVENGVNYNIKRYNDLRVLNERLTLSLKAKLDELDDQKSSFEDLHAMKNVNIICNDMLLYGRPVWLTLIFCSYSVALLLNHVCIFFIRTNKQAQTEDSMRIECLHRDTGQVERQIHEKTHYQRRLEHMLTRLKTNQVGNFVRESESHTSQSKNVSRRDCIFSLYSHTS